MRWVSPFIHQPGEHGCHRRAEAKWESSPSSVFVSQTLGSRFPSLIAWLWNAQNLARTSSSLSSCLRIKSRFFFHASCSKQSVLLASVRGSGDTASPFHWKVPGKVETLILSCKSIQSASCFRQFMLLKLQPYIFLFRICKVIWDGIGNVNQEKVARKWYSFDNLDTAFLMCFCIDNTIMDFVKSYPQNLLQFFLSNIQSK